MENTRRSGLLRLVIRFLVLIVMVALTAYGWRAGRTIARLQHDLERAVNEAEQARGMAEANAREAQRQMVMAMDFQRLAEVQRSLAMAELNDCRNKKK
jgi:hypothetical protein